MIIVELNIKTLFPPHFNKQNEVENQVLFFNYLLLHRIVNGIVSRFTCQVVIPR